MLIDSAAELSGESRVCRPRPAARVGASGHVEQDGRELAWVAYREHCESVWRLLRRLGVPDHKLDDAVQDVFMTVHRRADAFEAKSQLRTWVLGIAVRVAANARRALRRDRERLVELPDELPSSRHLPDEEAARRQAVVTLHRVLEQLEEPHRELFVLVDLELLSVPMAAAMLGQNVSTCYKRLEVARQRVNAAVERERAADERRLP